MENISPPVPVDVLLLVLHYRNAALTIDCMRSLQSSLNERVRLLVVDNGSQNGSAEEILSAFPGTSIYTLPKNVGFTGGFNCGIQRALESTARWILLISNDTLFDANAVEELSKAPYDVAVPKIVYYDHPEIIWAAGAQWRKYPPSVFMRGFNRKDSPEYNRMVPLDYATGCVIMGRREVFEAVRGFNPEFKYYMEDYEFSYRVRKAGFTMGYIPSARIRHKVSQTLGSHSSEQSFYLGRNTVLFYRQENRFLAASLGCYLAWFSLRELISGRVARLPVFWKGVRAGYSLLGQTK